MGHLVVDLPNGLLALAELIGCALCDGTVDEQVEGELGGEYALCVQVFL